MATSPPVTRKVTRNDFDTSLVNSALKAGSLDEDLDELQRLLGEACVAIEGLRKDYQGLRLGIHNLHSLPNSHWADSWHLVNPSIKKRPT